MEHSAGTYGSFSLERAIILLTALAPLIFFQNCIGSLESYSQSTKTATISSSLEELSKEHESSSILGSRRGIIFGISDPVTLNLKLVPHKLVWLLPPFG